MCPPVSPLVSPVVIISLPTPTPQIALHKTHRSQLVNHCSFEGSEPVTIVRNVIAAADCS